MVGALEYDERVGRGCRSRHWLLARATWTFSVPSLEAAESRTNGTELATSPSAPLLMSRAEHALSDQRVQLRQVLVSMKRGFVHGGLVRPLMWGISARM